MSPAELHADSIVIDGLIIAKWNRELFEDMRKGGLTAANCTVSVWEGFQATVNNIAASQKLIRENSDLVMPVRTTADIRRAKEQGKTGILFGFQNAHAFEDQLGYIEIFKQLGVGVVQMCYNTQNLVGTGCYERDGGLSDELHAAAPRLVEQGTFGFVGMENLQRELAATFGVNPKFIRVRMERYGLLPSKGQG